MLTDEKAAPVGNPQADALAFANQVIVQEAQALLAIANRLDSSFCQAVEYVLECSSSVIVTGMGKAGLVGQKIAATLASTGTRSHFLHPAEAVHGDLGRIHHSDLLLVLSFSGETAEVTNLLPSLESIGTTVIAITGNTNSTLARTSSVTLDLGPLDEACSLGLAPSTSTTGMLALGDALALAVSRQRQFRAEDFARFHPGGSLGRKLARIEDVMRPIVDCRIAEEGCTVRQVFRELGRPGRRTGAIMLTDTTGKLTGVFTDSDFARLFETNQDSALDAPIREVMTSRPTTIQLADSMEVARQRLVENKISELPVVDEADRPVGLIDITDLVGVSWEPNADVDAPLPSSTFPFRVVPPDGNKSSA